MRDGFTPLANLAWCALVALKQKRFPGRVSADIRWLLQKERRYGRRACLRQNLDWLYRSSVDDFAGRSDRFRLLYFVHVLILLSWRCVFVADGMPGCRKPVPGRRRAFPAVYLSLRQLTLHFSPDGKQNRPVLLRITGNTRGGICS